LIPKVAAPGILGLRAACCRFSTVSLLAVVIWMLFAAAGCEPKAAAGCRSPWLKSFFKKFLLFSIATTAGGS
jgi:hypothetical protein